VACQTEVAGCVTQHALGDSKSSCALSAMLRRVDGRAWSGAERQTMSALGSACRTSHRRTQLERVLPARIARPCSAYCAFYMHELASGTALRWLVPSSCEGAARRVDRRCELACHSADGLGVLALGRQRLQAPQHGRSALALGPYATSAAGSPLTIKGLCALDPRALCARISRRPRCAPAPKTTKPSPLSRAGFGRLRLS
jgi:hypothetical protein